MSAELDDIVGELRSLEERLRDLAYDRLRAPPRKATRRPRPTRRSCSPARRALERAINALGGSVED